MKKSNVVSLIQYHVERDNRAFMDEAFEIARDFDRNGDTNLSGYIMSLRLQGHLQLKLMKPISIT